MHSAIMTARHSVDAPVSPAQELSFTPSQVDDSEPVQIMSFKDMIAALDEVQDQLDVVREHMYQKSGLAVGPDFNSRPTTAEGPDSTSLSSASTKASERCMFPAGTLPSALPPNNDTEYVRTERETRLSFLAEFGVQTPIKYRSITGANPPATTATPPKPIHFQRSLSPFGVSESVVEEHGPERVAGDTQMGAPLTAQYSESQLSLFGDFLRSPFAPVTPSQADNIGISPLDTEAHVYCGCDSCVLFDFGLYREFSDAHPLANCLMSLELDRA